MATSQEGTPVAARSAVVAIFSDATTYFDVLPHDNSDTLVFVITTTVTFKKTEGPVNALFENAARGEGVRIRYGKKVYVLLDAKRVPKNYAEREYGVTPAELKAFAKRMDAQIEKERKAGLSKKFTGDIEELLRH